MFGGTVLLHCNEVLNFLASRDREAQEKEMNQSQTQYGTQAV